MRWSPSTTRVKAATDAISHAISDLVSKLSHSRIGENRETKNTTSNDPPYRPHLDTILHTALFIPWRPKGFIHSPLWSSQVEKYFVGGCLAQRAADQVLFTSEDNSGLLLCAIARERR